MTAPGKFTFTHALVREAIHEQLHPSSRTRFHESIALALERQHRSGDHVSLATLAHHFCMALPLTQRWQAATYCIAAGDSAHGAFAYEEAVFQFRRAQDTLGAATLTDIESCDLRLRLGAAEAGAGEWTRSRRTFEDAAALARSLNCPERLARAALGFKGMMFGTIPVDIEAVSLLREALSHLGDEHTELRVQTYCALSRALYFSDDPTLVHRYNALAVESASSLRGDRLAAELAETRLLANWEPSNLSVVRGIADHLLELSVRLRDPITSFRAHTYRYACFLSFGEALRAAQELHHAIDSASATQHPRPAWQAALLAAADALMHGKLTLATKAAGRARELGRRVHDSGPAQHDLVQSFQHARFTKDYSGWLSVVENSTNRYPNTVGYLAAQALLHSELNQLDESIDSLRHFARHGFRNIPANNFQLYTLAILSEAAARCRDRDSAEALYSLLVPFEHLHVVAGWGTVFDGSVAHYLALLAASMDQHQLCLGHFETALDSNRSIDASPLLARTQLEFARFMARSSEPDLRRRAHDLAASATATFKALTMFQLATQCSRVAQEAYEDPSTLRGVTTVRSAPEEARLARVGDVWNISFSGVETTVRHRLGFIYLALILSADGDPVHVLDLVTRGIASPTPPQDGGILAPDETARRSYKDRLRCIEEDIELAVSHNDVGRIDQLHSEREAIIAELSHSYGIGGAPRPTGSPVERARISVKNRLTDALGILKEHHHVAYQHLSRSLSTGTYCRYLPPSPTHWTVIFEQRS